MSVVRIIPRLDIKGPNLVKGIHLEGLRVLGRPADFAAYYYEHGADELMFMDVVASLYGRNSLHEIICETARSIFIPITVGGGLRTIDDIRKMLRAGADKVCLNTAAIGNPQLIEDASRIFGSSTIVIAIEGIKQPDGRYLAYTDNGREFTGIDVVEWAKRVNDLGAGEIVLTAVDREGTGEGFDIDLIKQVSSVVDVPVIAHGGAGKANHIAELFSETSIDAVAIASVLHYDYITHNNSEASTTEGNSEFLKNKRSFSLIEPASISQIKNLLSANKVLCRI